MVNAPTDEAALLQLAPNDISDPFLAKKLRKKIKKSTKNASYH